MRGNAWALREETIGDYRGERKREGRHRVGSLRSLQWNKRRIIILMYELIFRLQNYVGGTQTQLMCLHDHSHSVTITVKCRFLVQRWLIPYGESISVVVSLFGLLFFVLVFTFLVDQLICSFPSYPFPQPVRLLPFLAAHIFITPCSPFTRSFHLPSNHTGYSCYFSHPHTSQKDREKDEQSNVCLQV